MPPHKRSADHQFHWQNDNYASFDDFLATLASRKRKNLKKERAQAIANGIEIEWLTGDDLTEDHWDAFFAFYQDTSSRKWGQAYLNRTFFDLLHQRLADQIVLIMAFDGARPVAGALNLRSSTTLFGRNWGCLEDHSFLHFELCYYQAIDYALTQGLGWVEAGAQGGHKISRGYEPTLTYSSHFIAHPGFGQAVQRFLDEERAHMTAEQSYITAEMNPFKSTNAP